MKQALVAMRMKEFFLEVLQGQNSFCIFAVTFASRAGSTPKGSGFREEGRDNEIFEKLDI